MTKILALILAVLSLAFPKNRIETASVVNFEYREDIDVIETTVLTEQDEYLTMTDYVAPRDTTCLLLYDGDDLLYVLNIDQK